jgi:RNA polymerase sigma factor (sigma-70 family)
VVGRPLDEKELVARSRRGDADAYEELVCMYQGIAFRTAFLIAGNAPDAEEAAQDAFVKSYRALWRFRPGAPFKPWLLRIVANEARNRRRASGRRTALALRAAGDATPGDAAPSPEAALLGVERREELLAALNRLPDHDREALACRYFLDLSEAETAAALGVRRGTVKSRLSRALERLRAELEAASAAGEAGDARPENLGAASAAGEAGDARPENLGAASAAGEAGDARPERPGEEGA